MDIRPSVSGLSPDTRRARCARPGRSLRRWSIHTIAAFSALSLRLIALGAPPELIGRTHAAALEEVRHAQIAFALASAYADAPLAPARFDEVARLATTSTLAALARETFVDGCIEETAAAVDAALAATTAEDPDFVANALRSIAEDESRHAELAWAIVAWCVGVEPAITIELRALLAEQLAIASSITTPGPLARPDPVRRGVDTHEDACPARGRGAVPRRPGSDDAASCGRRSVRQRDCLIQVDLLDGVLVHLDLDVFGSIHRAAELRVKLDAIRAGGYVRKLVLTTGIRLCPLDDLAFDADENNLGSFRNGPRVSTKCIGSEPARLAFDCPRRRRRCGFMRGGRSGRVP